MDNFSSYQGGVTVIDDNFQRLSDSIGSNIQKISQNVSSMSKMVNQLQTPQDSQELRNQLRQIQNYTQQLAKDTSALLLRLMRLPAEGARRLGRDRLSDEYITTLNAFQATQRLAAQKTKEDVRKVKAQNVTISDPFALGLERNETGEPVESAARQQLAARDERELRELEERERDIRQLESDIVDVNQIFKELGALVHEQGSTVDCIEASVERAATDVAAASMELRSAATYKNKLRKKKVYLAIVLAIVISIILIIIFNR